MTGDNVSSKLCVAASEPPVHISILLLMTGDNVSSNLCVAASEPLYTSLYYY